MQTFYPHNLVKSQIGSIVSEKVEIQASKASFAYEDPSLPGNTSSGADISLSNDDDIAN